MEDGHACTSLPLGLVTIVYVHAGIVLKYKWGNTPIAPSKTIGGNHHAWRTHTRRGLQLYDFPPLYRFNNEVVSHLISVCCAGEGLLTI